MKTIADPTIRAALDASVRAYCCADGECPCGHYSACLIAPNPDTRDGMAKAIATFLRHFRSAKLYSFTLPDAWGSPFAITIETQRLDAIAAAVEQTAKEAGDE